MLLKNSDLRSSSGLGPSKSLKTPSFLICKMGDVCKLHLKRARTQKQLFWPKAIPSRPRESSEGPRQEKAGAGKETTSPRWRREGRYEGRGRNYNSQEAPGRSALGGDATRAGAGR